MQLLRKLRQKKTVGPLNAFMRSKWLKGTNPEIQPLCQGELTLFNDTWKLNIHSDGTAASWHKHFILWVENTIKVFPTAQRSSVFCEKANISNRFVCDSVRPFLPHLVGTNTIKRFSVSLHLDELSSVCRTRRAWFDLELIYSTFSRSAFLHAAVSHFRPNQMHLFGLQGVTASSEMKRVQTNGFLKCNSGAARNGAIRLQQVFLASDLLSLSIQLDSPCARCWLWFLLDILKCLEKCLRLMYCMAYINNRCCAGWASQNKVAKISYFIIIYRNNYYIFYVIINKSSSIYLIACLRPEQSVRNFHLTVRKISN